MVRETRHLWVGNLPDNIREDRIREHFKRYGRVQSVKLLPPRSGANASSPAAAAEEGGGGLCAAVAFMDIKSASKAHTAEHKLDERCLTTEYYEPPTAPTALVQIHERDPDVLLLRGLAAPAGSGAAGTAGPNSYPPRSPRYPHGPPEDSFERSSHFYRGSGSGGGAPDSEYLRRCQRTGDGLRGRTRDRLYRNGIYPSHNESGGRSSHPQQHRGSSGGGSSSWNYDGGGGTRYATPPDPNFPEEGPTRPNAVAPSSPVQSTPSGATTPSSHINSTSGRSRKGKRSKHKRLSKTSIAPAGSGSDSEAHSSGRGSRSRSSSRTSCSSSHSNASSSSSSASSRSPSSSKSCSPGSRSHSRFLQSSVSHHSSVPLHSSTYADDRRPLAICVRNLPARSSDTSLKDGLFHEYKKHGKVTWVKVVGQGADRYALVCFKKPEDVEKALEVSQDKLFFGCKINVAAYDGFDVDDNDFRPYENELDEFHPKATRTLFIGNLEKDITASEIRSYFEKFGEIIEIDVKKQGATASYAFCQYADIGSVVRAMKSMDGEHIGANRINLGFGKSMPTNCVWVDGISAETVSEKYLNMQFHQYGPIAQIALDRDRGHALVFFEQLSCAQMAVKDMRGAAFRGRKLQIDFASRECQEAFYSHLEKQGSAVERPWDRRASLVAEPAFEPAREIPAPRGTRYESASTPSTRPTPRSQHRGATPSNSTSSSRSSSSRTGRSQSGRYGAEYYEEHRFRNAEGTHPALGHDDSYEQELRDYGYSQRERRDFDGDPIQNPSPSTFEDEPGSTTIGSIAARRSSRQKSTASEPADPSQSPPARLTSPSSRGDKAVAPGRYGPNSRIHSLSPSPLRDHSPDKEAGSEKDSVSGSVNKSCDLRDPRIEDRLKATTSGNISDLERTTRSSRYNDKGSDLLSLPPPSAPDCEIKHLQKERSHIQQLLEQLTESHSSGDESSAAKRMRITLKKHELENMRKVAAEPRRLSDLKGRRISTESGGYYKEHHVHGPPYHIPKRRKTESSSENDYVGHHHGHHHHHHHHRDSSDSSRPGTPLCDERPTDPRKPRERSMEVLNLPLPRFAQQVLSPRTSSAGRTVYTIKSPPPACVHLNKHRDSTSSVTSTSSTKLVEERRPSASSDAPVPVLGEASSPSQVPSSPRQEESSDSADEDSSRASPTLEERIRMLDEKYEKWSGTRTLTATTATPETLQKIEAEKLKLRAKLPDLNEIGSQPSDIVKSLLAKRSVFDEDSKRLENYNEKYEPKEFSLSSSPSWGTKSLSTFQNLKTEVKEVLSWNSSSRVAAAPTPSSPAMPLKPILRSGAVAPPAAPATPMAVQKLLPPVKVEVKTPVAPTSSLASPSVSSPKSLQYPFPSHPPVSTTPPPPPPPTVVSASVQLPPAATTSTVTSSTSTSTAAVSLVTASQLLTSPPVRNSLTTCQPPLSSPVQSASPAVSVVPATELTATAADWSSRLEVSSGKDTAGSNNNIPQRSSPNSTYLPTPPPSVCSSPSVSSVSSIATTSAKSSPPPSSDGSQVSPDVRAISPPPRVASPPMAPQPALPVTAVEATLSSSLPGLEKEASVSPVCTSPDSDVAPEPAKQQHQSQPSSASKLVPKKENCNAVSKESSSSSGKLKKDSTSSSGSSSSSSSSKSDKDKDHVNRHSKKEHKKEGSGSTVSSSSSSSASSSSSHKHKHSEHKKEVPSKENLERKDSSEGEKKKERRDSSKEPSRPSKESVAKEPASKETVSKETLSKETLTKESAPKECVSKESAAKPPHSVPAAVGNKRRVSSQDSLESNTSSTQRSSTTSKEASLEPEGKKPKLSPSVENSKSSKKIFDRRESKDSTKDAIKKSEVKKVEEKKIERKHEKRPDEKKHESKSKSQEHRSKEHDKQKKKSRSDKEAPRDSSKREERQEKPQQPQHQSHTPHQQQPQPHLQQQSHQPQQSQHQQPHQQLPQQQLPLPLPSKPRDDDDEDANHRHKPKKDSKDKERKHHSSESSRKERRPEKRREEETPKPMKKKERPKKLDSDSDSAEFTDGGRPKQHSIFDIVDEGPVYISMYDKVKARSTKNMQKQEEEKRQEKLKKKFDQLKQSRAKREEKKRSTSWDEDSDSDVERERRKKSMHMISSSSEDEGKIRRIPHSDISNSGSEDFEENMRKEKRRSRTSDGSDTEDRGRSKFMASIRKPFKITSDTSDFEEVQHQKQSSKPLSTLDVYTDSDNDEIKRKPTFMKAKSRERFDSSADEAKTERIRRKSSEGETPKAHKKKQKKLSSSKKNSISSERLSELDIDEVEVRLERLDESRIKMETSPTSLLEHNKKHQSKRERRRSGHKSTEKKEQVKDENKTKKKKPKKESQNKDSTKMEDIFGPLSDNSEEEAHTYSKPLNNNEPAKKLTVAQVFTSDSDTMDRPVSPMPTPIIKSEPITEIQNHVEEKRHTEEKKKKKDKKSKDKRREKQRDEFKIKSEYAEDSHVTTPGRNLHQIIMSEFTEEPKPADSDVFRFTDDESVESVGKAKKKKRKKSKEEKAKHREEHKSVKSAPEERPKSPKKRDPSPVEEPKASTKLTPEPEQFDDLASPTQKKKSEKFIPGFGKEVDVSIHEDAIKSISKFPESPSTTETTAPPAEPLESPIPEEKPRTVISQEETEDAVAALLGETFDFRRFSDEGDPPIIEPSPPMLSQEDVANDESHSEIQQAVESLQCVMPGQLTPPSDKDKWKSPTDSAKKDEERPETPLSGNDLQIDEEAHSEDEDGLRYPGFRMDEPPKTPDINMPPSTPDVAPRTPDIDFSRPPKTPDFPAAYYQQQQEKERQKAVLSDFNSKLAAEDDSSLMSPDINKQISDIVESKILDDKSQSSPPREEERAFSAITEQKEKDEATAAAAAAAAAAAEEQQLKIPSIVVEEPPKTPALTEKEVAPKEDVQLAKNVLEQPLRVTTPIVKKVDVPVIRDLASQVLPKPEPPKVEPKPSTAEEPPKPVLPVIKEPSVEREATPVLEEPPAKPEAPALPEDKSDGSELLSPDSKIGSPQHEEINTRSRRGGRGRRSSRGGISTRRSARGSGSRQGWDGSTETLSAPETKEKPESQAEESSEEHKEEVKGKKTRKGRKKKTSECEDKTKPRTASECTDVYEFHDSEDEDFQFETKSAPSLSPIKSEEKPHEPPQEAPAPVVAEVKSEEPEVETQSDTHSDHPASEDESKLLHPPLSVITNVKSPPATRKSRRLLEKDTSRNTVDDVIEAVVKGKFSAEDFEISSPKKPAVRARSKDEEERKPHEKPIQGGSLKPEEEGDKDSEEKSVAPCTPVVAPPKLSPPVPPKLVEPIRVPNQPTVMHIKGPGQPEEPTTLIDPVTGLLMPMRESEEGQYIPVTTSSGVLVLNSADSRLLGRQPHLVRLPPGTRVMPSQMGHPLNVAKPVGAQPPKAHAPVTSVAKAQPPPPAPSPIKSQPSAVIAQPSPVATRQTPTPSRIISPAAQQTPPPPQQLQNPSVVKVMTSTPPAPSSITVAKVQQPPVAHPQSTPPAARVYPPRSEGTGPAYAPWPPTSTPVSVVQAAPQLAHPSVITAGGRGVEMPRPAHMGPATTAAPPAAHLTPAHTRFVTMAGSPSTRMTMTASPPVQRSLTITPSSSPGLSSKVSPLPPGRQPVAKPMPPQIPMAHSSSSHPTSVLEQVTKPMPGTVPYHPQPAHSGAAQFSPSYRPAETIKKPDKKPESKDELPLSMLPPRLRVGAVARTAALPGASGLATEPPKVDVNISGCIVANQQQAPSPARSSSRESPLARPMLTHAQVLQAGMPIPAYEASLQQHAVEPPVSASGGSTSAYYAPPPSLPPPSHHLSSGGQVIERVRNRPAASSAGARPLSPPPAHQQGDVVRVPPEPHVAYGSLAHHHMRPGPSAPRDLYLVQQHLYHQQLMRAQQEQHMPHHYHHLPPGAVRSPAIPGLETQKADQPEAGGEAMGVHSPPLELRRPASRGARHGPVPPAHLLSPHDRSTDSPQVATVYGGAQRLMHHHHLAEERLAERVLPRGLALPSHLQPQYLVYEDEYSRHEPPPAHHRLAAAGAVHSRVHPIPAAEAPPTLPLLQTPILQQQTPPRETFLDHYPVVWRGFLSLKNDQAYVQMHFIHGSKGIALDSLPVMENGQPSLKIAQRMRLEPSQLEGVTRKIKAEEEHCVLLAMPFGVDEHDHLLQSSNLYTGFHNYLMQKSAAGIVNTQSRQNPQATHSYVVHIFPGCMYAADQLGQIAPDLMTRVKNMSHLLIVVATNT